MIWPVELNPMGCPSRASKSSSHISQTYWYAISIPKTIRKNEPMVVYTIYMKKYRWFLNPTQLFNHANRCENGQKWNKITMEIRKIQRITHDNDGPFSICTYYTLNSDVFEMALALNISYKYWLLHIVASDERNQKERSLKFDYYPWNRFASPITHARPICSPLVVLQVSLQQPYNNGTHYWLAANSQKQLIWLWRFRFFPNNMATRPSELSQQQLLSIQLRHQQKTVTIHMFYLEHYLIWISERERRWKYVLFGQMPEP